MSKILDNLVAVYGMNDAEMKRLKGICDKDKEQIKELMAKEPNNKYTAGGYTVTYIVSEDTTVDEEKMLSIIKRDWANHNGSMECPYIRRVEVLDMDALESAIYSEKLSKEVIAELGACTTKKPRVTLKCSKVKEKKDE